MNLSHSKRRKYLRRCLLALLVFVAAMAQNVPWLPVVYGVRALPLIPIVVSIAVLDQAVPAVLFGAAAGLLWDFSSADVSFHAAYLTLTAFVCTMLMRYIFNRNWRTVALLMLLFTAGDTLLRWLAGGSLRASFWPLLHLDLPGLGYTLVLAPLCYWLTRCIVKHTSRRQKAILTE